jgi:hypothetical protein
MGADVPALFARLIDDAAVFPPARTPLAEAVAAHIDRKREAYAGMVGPFLCADVGLPDLATTLDRATAADPGPAAPCDVAVVITGGAGAIGPALTWAARIDRLRLAGVEVALRDEPPLARNVARVTLALDHAGLADAVPVSVEVPRTEGWPAILDALDALAETGYRAKLRTGGEDAAAHPSEDEVARFVLACLDRQISFKCTAGLHHAVRTTSTEGFTQHGFLNVALATRAALDGAGEADLVGVLADRDAASVADGIRAMDEATAGSTRRWFCSFGSCSVSEPVAALRALGFLQD